MVRGQFCFVKASCERQGSGCGRTTTACARSPQPRVKPIVSLRMRVNPAGEPVELTRNRRNSAGVTEPTSKQTNTLGAHQQRGQALPPPQVSLGVASFRTASSGHGFICLFQRYEDHPLGTRNAAGQSDITLCTLVCQSERQSLSASIVKRTDSYPVGVLH